MPVTTSDHELARRQRCGDGRARAQLIERHLPLARRLAARYRGRGEPYEDLVQVASVGLIKAADRWDPERGTAFSTYAVPTILGELRRYFRDATWAVRPPRGLTELTASVERARVRLEARDGREPSAADLARELDRTVTEIVRSLEARQARYARSLDALALDDPEPAASVGEQLGTEEPGFARAEARATLERLVTGLDRRAREVLHLVFAADLTQTQVAQRLGCSQVQVSRIVARSLAALRLSAAAP